MIERQIVNGREAIVSYLKADWTPASPDDADLVKITYLDDNSTIWLTPKER